MGYGKKSPCQKSSFLVSLRKMKFSYLERLNLLRFNQNFCGLYYKHIMTIMMIIKVIPQFGEWL
jgi:hypothetical protein